MHSRHTVHNWFHNWFNTIRQCSNTGSEHETFQWRRECHHDSNLLSLQSWNQPIPRDSASCRFHVHSRMNTMRSWKHMQAWMITLQTWKACSHTRTCWMMRFSLNGWNHAGIITTCRIPHWFQCLQRTWFIMARLNMKHGNSCSIP